MAITIKERDMLLFKQSLFSFVPSTMDNINPRKSFSKS